MNENASSQADVERESNVSAIWLIPLIALAIGIWMLYQFVESQGPEIKLIMSDAAGIEVGKTEIKSLNVSVGVVTSVKFGESYDHIEVTAQMTKDAERMLHSDTLFWVVEPRIGKEGISGLRRFCQVHTFRSNPVSHRLIRMSSSYWTLRPLLLLTLKGLEWC